MGLLTPDLGLLFWMLISFGLVFGILAKFGFPVITRMVDKRRDYIQKSLEDADAANVRLQKVEVEAAEMIAETKKQQIGMLAKATRDSEKIIQSAHDKATLDSAHQLAIAKEQIEHQKQKTLGELRSTVAALSVDVAEKILRKQLDDSSVDNDFIGRMIDEAEKQDSKLPS